MKRYYICPKSVWEEICDVAGVQLPRHHLMPASHYVELEDGHILIATEFASVWAEDQWHSHPDVARLADPMTEATLPLAHICGSGAVEFCHKQFKAHHFEKLKSLLAQHGHALDDTHTVRDLHRMLTPHYPGMRLNFY
jgi:hypothetical protein